MTSFTYKPLSSLLFVLTSFEGVFSKPSTGSMKSSGLSADDEDIQDLLSPLSSPSAVRTWGLVAALQRP